MSNSPLVNYTKISPNKTCPRNHVIDTITIHCAVGQISVETLGDIFLPKTRQASSNYGIGADGRIGMYVEEKDRSWCSSNKANDNRAITIECACDKTAPYAINDKVYVSLINLCADICKRNNIKELKWCGDKSLIGQIDKQNLTVHRWFANTECPGEDIYNRLGQIAADVNKKLSGNTESDEVTPTTPICFNPYMVRVKITNLNIRKGPGTNYTRVSTIAPGSYTIVDERSGLGSKKGWGKLKSGVGWISLDYATKI